MAFGRPDEGWRALRPTAGRKVHLGLGVVIVADDIGTADGSEGSGDRSWPPHPLSRDQSVTYCDGMDPVFKALADPTRRELLDELFRHDGQTLSELEASFAMTRFGVMKHLKLLEAAGLVVIRRHGREKHHFLNPVPIRLLHDRWVSKYTASWASGLGELKRELERTMEQVYELYIRTTPDRLWQAITDPEIRARYNFGAGVRSEWTPGATLEQVAPGGHLIADGEVLAADPPRRLVHTYRARWSEDVAAEGLSRVTWEIEQVADSCRLTVVHDQLRAEADSQLYGGWPMILSGLKTFLETGELLTTPGSLRYADGG